MSEIVSISKISGKISKGDRQGQEWQGIKIQIGEWSRVILQGKDSIIKTGFEMKYIISVLEKLPESAHKVEVK